MKEAERIEIAPYREGSVCNAYENRMLVDGVYVKPTDPRYPYTLVSIRRPITMVTDDSEELRQALDLFA